MYRNNKHYKDPRDHGTIKSTSRRKKRVRPLDGRIHIELGNDCADNKAFHRQYMIEYYRLQVESFSLVDGFRLIQIHYILLRNNELL